MRTLLHFGANPLILDRHGFAPIHYCAREDFADCFLEILRAGFDGAHPTRFKQSPLHIACKAGSTRVAHLLSRWDADHIPSKVHGPGIIRQRDSQGKLPAQLIPRSSTSKCLETLWGASRAGDTAR